MTSLDEIKSSIWSHPKVNKNIITLQTFADGALVRLPINTVENAQKLLDFINKPKKTKRKATISPEHINRYIDAHKLWFAQEYPGAYQDGHYPGMEPDIPDTATANGLQSFITKFTTWMGCHANRINTSGRQVNGKWITGTTKKGTADLSLIISGRSIHLEIKVGNDKPSEHQIKQQAQIRKAGGAYEFIHNVEEFFKVWDRYYVKVLSIFDTDHL